MLGLNWGASVSERSASLPCDELVPGARGSSMGLAIGAGTVGRGLASVATTSLYTVHGMGGSSLASAACAAASLALLLLFVREPGLPSGR